MVRTKKGNWLPVMKGGKRTRIDALAEQELEKRGLRNKRRGPDSSYNCHGLTFVGKLGCVGTSRCGTPRLVLKEEPVEAEDTDEHIVRLLIDNGYHKVAYRANIRIDDLLMPPEVEVGDVILYVRSGQGPSRIEHSGVVVQVPKPGEQCIGLVQDVLVLSKFGGAGEYVHPYRTIPEKYATGLEVWTDREV